MKNNLHTELRESWKKAMGKPPNFEVMDKLTGGMRCCELCGVSADKIADWWLQKFDELQSATSPDSIVKQDTLESLIEECGDEFASLRQPGGHGGFGLITGREAEYEKWLKEHSGKWEAHGTQKHFHGKTPKEAVERLLKELRKR